MVDLGEWIFGHYQKVLLVALVLWGGYYAYTRPYSLGDPATYVTLIGAQLLLAAVFHYRRLVFGAVMASFLWAGMNLPMMRAGVAARWPILLVAAIVGLVLWLKEERQHFGAMHFVALACAVAALTSATVSAFPRIAFLKASSLVLLLLYASGGVRVAILNCEHDFVRRLVDVAEIIGYLTAACYFGLHFEIFGNPNSLGAVAGAALVPLAMWAVWVADTPNLRRRRLISLAVSVVLLVSSRSRAGILSSALTAAFFLLSLRRYRLFLRAATVGIAVVSLIGLWDPDLIWKTSEDVNSNLVYKGHREKGLLGSRMQPWNDTMETIREHPFLGGGFGTTATGAYSDAGASAVTTSPATPATPAPSPSCAGASGAAASRSRSWSATSRSPGSWLP